MHVLSGYVECYKFVDEPRHIEYAFTLVDSDEVIILGIFFSKLHHEAVVRLDGLVHIVEAEVARNNDGAFGMDVKLKIAFCTAYVYRHTHFSALDFVLFQGAEPSVAKVELKGCTALVQILQIYLKLF